jgi:predicted CXXCH cytochrome family protein
MSDPRVPSGGGRSRGPWVVFAIAVAVVLGGVGTAAIVIGRDLLTVLTASGGTPAAHVPRSWRDVRDSDGHRAHVADEQLACRECHTVSDAAAKGPDEAAITPFTPPTSATCSRCHEQRSEIHASPFLALAGDCLDCHGFGAERIVRPAGCMRCHAEPTGFATPAIGLHARAECTDCHRPHESPSLQPRTCVECHDAEVVRHGGGDRGDADACTTCHQVHDPAQAPAARCAGCHLEREPTRFARALFADRGGDGHTTCVGCHRPHGFSAAQAAPCASCHAAQPVLGAPKAHTACTSCHSSHDVRRPKACASCHADVHPDHPRDSASTTPDGACLGCHPIHGPAGALAAWPAPATASAIASAITSATAPSTAAAPATAPRAIAVACSRCHTQPSHAPSLACAGCHRPHDFRLRDRGASLCAGCHTDKASGIAGTGHARCLGCHLGGAHLPAAPPRTCASCHTDKAKLTATVRNGGHADCLGCHTGGPHAPRVAPRECASCHTTQAATVPFGHRNCQACHQPHDGAQRRDVTCTGCHDRAKLPGMHQVPGHQPCASCHRGHDPAAPMARATCATCHPGKEQHEPTAKVCNGCHVFQR